MDPNDEGEEFAVDEAKTLYEPEGNSGSDSEGDDNYQSDKRRRPRGEDRGYRGNNKQLFGEKRGKILIFSSSSASQDNGRGRGRDGGRNRGGRQPRSAASEDREDGAGYSSRKNVRVKTHDKGGDGMENYAEDGRIGRQLRLLTRETDEEAIMKICQQLQEAFVMQENVRYVRYNLLSIGNGLMDVYKVVTSIQARREVSTTLARLGYVSDHDFHTFAKWILASYQKESNEKICCAIMDALTGLLKLNESSPRLKNIDSLLLPGLQSSLEAADTPDLFDSTLNPVLLIAMKNPGSFLPYFRDTVDILVGWFIDPAQPSKVARSASRALQSLRLFWKEDLPFSKTLLSQFLEDLDAYVLEAKDVVEDAKTEEEEEPLDPAMSLKKISSLLNVFSVVGAQVVAYPDSDVYSADFLNSALSKISQCTNDLLSLTESFNGWNDSDPAMEDLIQYANEAVSLLIIWLADGITPEALKPCLHLLERQVESSDHYQYPLVASMFHVMTCLAEQRSVASQLTVQMIKGWMDVCNRLVESTQHRGLLSRAAHFLRTMIKIRNVPLLIEVYRRILAELNQSFIVLNGDKRRIGTSTEEKALLFLSPLAELGRSSSFVGMWALDPSLLNFLVDKLQPIDRIRSHLQEHPTLLLGILRVLHDHAKSHGHFVANSCLLASSAGGSKNFHSSSPTSGNLSLILNLLTDLCAELGSSGSMRSASSAQALLLQWVCQLLDTCKPCMGQLSQSDIFQRFLSSVVGFCHASAAGRSLLPVHSVLSALLDLPDLTFKTDLAVDIAKTCIVQLRKPADSVYLHLLGRCPPQVVGEATRRMKKELLANSLLSSWIQNESTISARNAQHFFDHILKGTPITSLESIYNFHMGCSKTASNPPSACDLAYWLALQTALLCVNGKLRSPLGKPQDTFLSIEDAIKCAAAQPTDQESVTEQNVAQLCRVRLLLSFFEILEKLMCNAFDGCSVALPLAPKPIRVFFRTNQTTCQEWVNRITYAAMTASVRAGRHASAARYGLNLLTHWTNTRRTVDVADLENVLYQLVQSLIRLEASQQIRGLKQWLSAPKQADYFQAIELDFLDSAALQAESKHEEALGLYKTSSKMSSFTCNQMLNAYTALADWEGFLEWRKQNPDWLGAVSTKQTAELVQLFDCRAHLQWPEKPPASAEAQWSVSNLLAEAKTGLLVAADRIRSSRSVYPAPASAWKIFECQTNSSFELSHLADEDANRCWLALAHALSYKADTAYLWMDHTRSVLSGASRTDLPHPSSALSLEWSRWLHWYAGLDRQAADMITIFSEANLSTVSLARQEGNLKLAERQLFVGLNATPPVQGQSHDLCTLLMNQALKMKLNSVADARLSIRLQFEGAKLLHQKGETDAAISVMTQCSLALSRSIQSSQTPSTDAVLPYMAESFTLLAKWLQDRNIKGAAPLKNLSTLIELANANQGDVDHVTLVSKLMERASQFAPLSAEAWLAWGQFQYARAEKGSRLTVEHLQGALPAEEASRLVNTLDELAGGVERALMADAGLKKKPAVLKRLLAEVQARKSTSAEGFNGALKAFFRYLNIQSSESSSHRRDTVDVTLRVLRIFSRNMEEVDSPLKEILATEIERTPSSSWRTIIPQLLSMLQYGQPWFKSLISQLLSRLAAEWPQLLVFPLAIGAAGLAWSWSTDPMDLDEDGHDPAVELQNLYQEMLDRVAVKVPLMVKDVELLLTELRRLVLLRDELWVAVLQQVHPQMEQLIQKLQAQGQKLSKKTGLIESAKKELLHQHFNIHFQPILQVLETVASITEAPAETPHEIWFQQRYSKTISDGIEQFKSFNSSSERFNPQELWMPFKNMLQQLQHVNYRRSVIKLEDVSPALKQLKGTRIPVPGENGDKQMATLFINSIENHVVVLPTKTKPKKFVFTGSDGKRYAYLFKGMEDLHLDQRIMQILSLANVLLEDSSKNRYRARHYAVIPLGPRSGLIQWVEGVTPLFALYKRWLQRQASTVAQGKGEKDTPAAVPRPSELFYNKLTPLLEAEGLSTDPRQRSQWPIEALRRVLNELMEETPKDLVARELWLGSMNAEQWWNSTLRFGRSCAVMSMIGYVIGLGDRHLDNVLVDLRCGEIVHIDYNICFEKGRQLRVPENVPFRLTANIQHALGAAGTGLEGTFRLSCIDVMKSLRENRDLFLILLEHFVYDPLVDWRSPIQTGSHESMIVPLYVVDPSLAARCSRQKRKMETAATLELFRLRSAELGPDWELNHKEMNGAVTSLSETAAVWMDLNGQIEKLQEMMQDLHEDRLALFDIRSDKNHVMRQAQQLQSILLPLRTSWEGEKAARIKIKEMVESNTKWIQLYEMAFNSLTTNQIKQWTEKVSLPAFKTGFSLVSEFLTSSGQATLAQQGETLDQQIQSLEENQRAAASVVINLLGTYASLASQYPPNKLENHRTQLMTTWAKELDVKLSAETCQRLAAEFQDHFSLDSPAWLAKQQMIMDFNLLLRRLLNEVSLRLHQSSVDLMEGSLNNANSDLMDAKEAVNSYCLLHGTQFVNYAVLERLCRACQELPAQDDGPFDFGATACIAELLQTCKSTGPEIQDLVEVLQLIAQLHQDVHEFVFNGATILLPELIRRFECSAPDILHLHEELEALCIDINHSNMDITRLGYQDLLGEGQDDAELSQGQMLLLGLNGLFEKLESNLLRLVESLKTVAIPESNLAILAETRERVEVELFGHLDGTLLAQRLVLITSLFQNCADWAKGFQTGSVSPELQHSSLAEVFERMAKSWTAQFLPDATRFSLLLLCARLGSGTVESNQCGTLEDLLDVTRKSIENSTDSLIEQACELMGIVDDQWRKCERVRMAHQRQEIDRGLLQLFQQQLTTHAWIHDTHAGLNSACGLFLLNLRQSLSVLLSQSSMMTELHQQMTNLTGQVEQRLKWAAGANPNVRNIMKEFNDLQSDSLHQLQEFSALATSLGGVSSAILHYESFRTRTPEALAADSAYIQLLSQCQDVCLLKDGWAHGRLSDAELRLAQRITPDGAATEEWINLTEKTLTDNINAAKESIAGLQSKQAVCAETLRQLNAGMRVTLTSHHQMINDVRSVLKIMAKSEAENGPVTRYLDQYRQFSELCSSVSRHLAAKEYDASKTSEIRNELLTLRSIIDIVYNGLEELSQVYVEAPARTRNSDEGKVNSVAASVWHRVRLKLEGRDPDENTQLTVKKQVDELIAEATHLDNLALLYEGWTPWV